ncbi:hypothetical protein JW988_06345 [Candidatus Bathyarchaeota archaeon]|nr:hypothetical protein [Candidatus Bathyarchaeota archaeon]
MQAKKTVAFFSVLLLLSTLTYSVDASSDATMSFSGGGVTVYLTYPEEARPNSTITHNITITAIATTTLQNFTTVIKASVNSSWVEIFSAQDTFSKDLPHSYNLTVPLPQEANGTLQCFIFVDTSSIDDLSTTLYTTLVSEPTFSEMQVLYYEMLANYTSLQEDYEARLDEYDILLANYSSLLANYSALISEHNQLITDYNNKVSTYETLFDEYEELSVDYNNLYADYRSEITKSGNLQADYNELNSTRYSLQTSYDTLQAVYDALNETYTNLQGEFNVSEGLVNSSRIVMVIFIIVLVALIVFIVYIKRKKEDPYLVIRKETVSMKSDEET